MTLALDLVALLIALVPLTAAEARDVPAVSERVLEIRSYNLKSGTRESFHELFEREALPLLQRWKVDVVAYGPSLHDRDSYFLMRAFPSLKERDRTEEAFYGSAEWRDGPRAAVLAAIDNYTTIVISVDEATLRSLRGTMHLPKAPSDLDTRPK
jgi:hypothetical protein